MAALGLSALIVAKPVVARGEEAGDTPVEVDRRRANGSADEPRVGRLQKVVIARESILASMRSLVRQPVSTSAQINGRVAERAGVRARRLALSGGAATTSCAHTADPFNLGGCFGGKPTAARISLHVSSESSIQALVQLVACAARRIDLMIYGWQDDPTGREVAEALAVAARRGVRVRLLVDRTGFLIHNPAAAEGRPTFLDALRCVPNVAVIESPGTCLRFDHRKLAVVDGRVAWTGGMILTEAARRRWHNLAFSAEGPIVAQFACVFEERWREVGGRPEGPAEVIAGPQATSSPNATVRLVQTNIGDRTLKDAIYHAVDHARHHVYLENPYFTDEILTAKLEAARARGVDVRAVVTVRGNVETINRYVRLTADRLVRAGVRVYLYPCMTHVKAMSADGVWAYLGTGNFDELSLRNNREVGLSVTGAELAAELERRLFLPDMAAARELTGVLPRPPGSWLLELSSLWY